MTGFRYSQVIHDAWEKTTQLPQLKWFAFIPGFAAVLVFVCEVAWQTYLFMVERESLGSGIIQLAGDSFRFLLDHHLFWWALFLVVFVVLFAFVFPPLIFSTLVLGVRQKRKNPERKVYLRQKIYEGAHYFFPIFEFNAMVSIFQFTSILFFSLTLYRYYHGAIFHLLLPFILFHSILAFFVNLFLVFTPYYMVCENMPLGSSIKRSIGLVFIHMGTTVWLMLLMFIVNLRVILNVVVILGVPLSILAAGSYFASSAFYALAVGGAIALGVVLLYLAAYLTAILEVFSTAVWEQSFELLGEEQKRIEDPNVQENLEAV